MAKPVLLLVESNEEVLKQIQRDLERRYGRRYRVRAATSGLFKEFRRALLAYDGSDAARRAMEMLARVAFALGLEIDAVQLVEEGAETTALKEVLLYFKDFPMAVSTHYLVFGQPPPDH